MDTLRDRNYLEELVDKGEMPWLDQIRNAGLAQGMTR